MLRDSRLLQYKCEQSMLIASEFGVTKVVKGVLWLKVWRSYRLGKSFIIDIRPSRSIFLHNPDGEWCTVIEAAGFYAF